VVDVVTVIYVQGSIEIPRVRFEILSSAYQLTGQTQVVSAITPAIGLPIGELLKTMRWQDYEVGYVREVLLAYRTQTLD
jgi:hypothetical protein